MTFTDDLALEARCRTLIEAVDLSRADTTEGLVDAVAAHLDVPIRMHTFPRATAPDVSGGCLIVGQDVVIAYPGNVDRWYQQVAVGHELGHLLCGHLVGIPSPADPADPALRNDDEPAPPGPTADDDLLTRLLPDLLEAHQTWQLYRCAAMSPIPEREAEMVGSLLIAQLERHRAPRSPEAHRLTGLVNRRDDRTRRW